MKKIFPLILLLIQFGAHAQSITAFLDGADYIKDLKTGEAVPSWEIPDAPGIYGELSSRLFDSDQCVTFVRVSPCYYSIDILCEERKNAGTTSSLCKKAGAVAGINGSYFNMSELTSITYVKDNGRVVTGTVMNEKFRTSGILSICAGNPDIAADTTASGRAWEAIASGPILIDDGRVITYGEGISGWDSFYNRRHPRSLVGIDGDGFLWLIVADGRSKGNADGMTIDELTKLSALIGLTDALNLDGGGSSTLWTEAGDVINHPCDNRKFDHNGERVVPNAIAIIEK